MKKFYIFIAILVTLSSCEDVVDVDLNTVETRLVIDASINWFKGTSGSEQSVKLSLTTAFFDNSVPPANEATVIIADSNNNSFQFIEEGNTGVYINNNFIPIIDEVYTLTINYNNETYVGTEILKSVASIDYVEQDDEGGFSGEDIELKAFYTDPVNIENYYFFEFISDIPIVPTLEVYEDRFTDGNQIFGFYTEEDLETGDEVIIRNYGISEQFYEFMFILLQQASEENSGPFETQPATVRGNCINVTNPNNYPYGYFRLSEVDELIYIVQ